MKRSVASALLCAALALAGAGVLVLSAVPARAASAPKIQAVVMEDALDAFFYELDKKSTALYVASDLEPIEVPAFPKRAELLARFTARQPRLDQLRLRALAGETNRGFVEARGVPSNAEQGVIAEENTDRLALYEAIAEQTKAKVDAVGRARAEKIGPMARRSVWVQDRSGEWAQKK